MSKKSENLIFKIPIVIFWLLVMFFPGIVLTDQINVENKKTCVKNLLEKAADYRPTNYEERIKAIEMLVNLSSEDIPYIIEELDSRDITRRIVLIKVITRIGSKAVPFLEKLLDQKDES